MPGHGVGVLARVDEAQVVAHHVAVGVGAEPVEVHEMVDVVSGSRGELDEHRGLGGEVGAQHALLLAAAAQQGGRDAEGGERVGPARGAHQNSSRSDFTIRNFPVSRLPFDLSSTV